MSYNYGSMSASTYPSAAPPAYATAVSMMDTKGYTTDKDVISVAAQHGISPYFATQLGRVEDFADVHLIIDDSLSTGWQFKDHKTYQPITVSGCSNAWDLQKSMIRKFFPVLASLRSDKPTLVHRLNKDPAGTAITSLADLQPIFNEGWATEDSPSCGTPTMAVMDSIPHTEQDRELGVLTLLLTDGEPNGGFDLFRYWLTDYKATRKGSFVQIGLASCDPELIKKYETAIDGIDGVDVSCVYEIEQTQITKIQGKSFTFTPADWIIKFLLGAKVTEWDGLDDRKLSREERKVVEKHAKKHYTSLIKDSTCSVM